MVTIIHRIPIHHFKHMDDVRDITTKSFARMLCALGKADEASLILEMVNAGRTFKTKNAVYTAKVGKWEYKDLTTKQHENLLHG